MIDISREPSGLLIVSKSAGENETVGAGFVPGNYNPAVVDEIVRVSNEDAFATAKALGKQEGILAGISSGAIVWAALQVAQKLGEGKTVVTIVCDSGERYISTKLFAEE